MLSDERRGSVGLGVVDFRRLDSLAPATQPLWYSLETAHDGWLTAQTAEEVAAGAVAIARVSPPCHVASHVAMGLLSRHQA